MQLICAIEAFHYFNPSFSALFIRYNDEKRNDTQIRNLLNYGNFDKTYYVTIPTNKLFSYYKIIYVFACLLIHRPSTLFIGNFKTKFMRLIYKRFDNSKVIFLDDGAQSSYFYYENPKANMFSYFLFPNILNTERLYIHNNFQYFKKIIKNTNKVIHKDQVFFIGAPIVEKNVVSDSVFHNYFHLIVDYYTTQGKEIIYIPHRHENIDKLNGYKGIHVKVIDDPIEIYLMQTTDLADCVASFYSAALYTIQLLFSEQINDITAFYLPSSDFLLDSAKHKHIEDVYKMFEGVIHVNKTYY